MKQARIIAQDPSIDITVPMGDGGATITSGLGGWQTVDRQDDIAATDWSGQPPLMQDVPLLLDGFAEGRSVEGDLNTLFKLGRDAVGNENVPPVFQVFGPIYFSGDQWVLPEAGIDLLADSVIRDDDGTLLRQGLVLHLMEYVPPDVVKLRGKKSKSNRGNPTKTGGTAFPGTRYTVRAGDTLVKIAAKLYGDWKRWRELGRKNNIRDPNKVLKTGSVLKL